MNRMRRPCGIADYRAITEHLSSDSICVVRQVLLRVPDDLHARLVERAQRSGRSLNTVATEILDRGVADESSDSRAALRARARRLGVLASRPAAPMSPADRSAAIGSTRGIGPVLDDLLADGR
jgi:plasmid stability protein